MCQGADKRPDAPESVVWHVAMKPGKRKVLDKTAAIGRLKEQLEKVKASMRAKVEHPFRVIKRQFVHVKVRNQGLAKNTAQLKTLFALSNLWMAREETNRNVLAPDGKALCAGWTSLFQTFLGIQRTPRTDNSLHLRSSTQTWHIFLSGKYAVPRRCFEIRK